MRVKRMRAPMAVAMPMTRALWEEIQEATWPETEAPLHWPWVRKRYQYRCANVIINHHVHDGKVRGVWG